MAKKLNTVQVNMQFNTDTNKAKQQMQDLQNSLTKLLNSPTQINIDASKIREATIATTELQAHLKNATNVDTGNLDFSKLSQSLKKSGKTLQEYGDQLRSLGPQGQQAFMQLTQAVVSAEVPIKRTNALLKEFANTLANTARWQISSSIIHGFTGALQSAYGYAQDLNESLNNIRIVTGRSVDDMADFAKEANKAAKALSTTTTKYTDASLIYYQQGLGDKEVKERADVTIKLANVSRQSAQEVSEQMTAIWNNFDDGSKSLEHYADVLSALGAATASSTEEIAGGLEKFAAVADTIGLSYEYAAAALATITSNTRQSEEVVGTALKTIFARIQGLNLGETLEDGTTLNKYSEALDKVGVNIYDANRQLKDMDTILNELGGKWNSLGKDQQVALAQTVAGVRQYNQLIALMDNWNKSDSDSFMANLSTANNATGELDKQADIYAESWEAAADRVTAAAEAIYDSLINDEFFIDLLNNVEKLLDFINNLIEGLGGLKGVLFALGAVVTKVFSQQMAQGLANLAYNIKMSTKGGRDSVQREKSKFIEDAANKMAKSADTGEAGYDQKKAAELYEQQLLRQQELIENADRMSEIEKYTVQSLMEQLKLRSELSMKAAEDYEQSKQRLSAQADLLYQRAAGTSAEALAGAASSMQGVKNIVNKQREFEAFTPEERTSDNVRNFTAGIDIIDAKDQEELNQLADALDNVALTSEELDDIWMQIKAKIASIADNEIEATADALGATKKEVEEYAEAYEKNLIAQEKNNKATKDFEKTNKSVIQTIKTAKGVQKDWTDALVKAADVAMSVASVISMITGMINTLSDTNIDGWQKFTTILSTLAILIPTVMSTVNGLNNALNLSNAARLVSIARLNEETAAQGANILAKTLGIELDTASKIMTEALAAGKGKLTVANILEAASNNGLTISKGLETAATVAQTVANWGLLASMPPLLAISLVLIAAIAGLALIIWGIVSAAQALSDAYNKDAIAAEKAEQAAKNLAETYNDIKSSYEDMISTMREYREARDALDDLTVGTIEYEEALLKANQAAQELIRKYDDLEYSLGSNGLIEISEESLKKVQKEELNKVEAAQFNMDRANLVSKQAANKANRTELLRSTIQDTSWDDHVGNILGATGAGAAAGTGIGAGIGATVGAVGGSAGGPIGTLLGGGIVGFIGGAIGLITGTVAGLITGITTTAISLTSATEQEEKAIDKLVEAQATYGNMAHLTDEEYAKYLKEDLKIDDEDLIKSLTENRDQMEKLAGEIHTNTETMKALDRQLVGQTLNDNEKVQDSEYTDEIVKTVANFVSNDRDKHLTSLEDEKWGETGDKNNIDAKNAFSEYAAAAGLTGVKLAEITGSGTDRVFKYRDANGDEHEVDLEIMRSAVADARTRDQINDRGEEIADIYNRIDKDKMATVNAAVNKDYSKLSISQIKNGFDGNTADILGLSEDDVKKLGYETKTLFNEAMAAASTDAEDDWTKILAPHTQAVKDTMDAIADSSNEALLSMSYDTIKAYGNVLETINQQGGEAAVSAFNTGFEGLMTTYADKSDLITSAINNIDWTKGEDSLQEFNYQLLQMGINVDESTPAWNSLISAIQKMNISVLNQDVNTLRSTLADIQKLTKDIEIGDIISDEDYNRLIKYNAALADYFIMTADGYRYIGGNKKDLGELAGASSAAALANTKVTNEKARTAAEAFSAVTWADGTKEDWYGLASGSDADWRLADMAISLAKNYASSLETIGVKPSWLTEVASVLRSTTSSESQKNNARTELQNVYKKIIELKDKVAAGDYDDDKAEEIHASSANSVAEIDEMVAKGEIGPEAAKKQKDYLTAEEKRIKKENVNHYEDETISAIDNRLEIIDAQKDLVSDEEYNKLVREKSALYKKKLSTQKSKRNNLSKTVKDSRTSLSKEYGVQFDEYGNISNWEELAGKYAGNWEEVSKVFTEYETNLGNLDDAELDILDTQSQLLASSLETYEAADEALAKYTARLEHHNNVLDQYKSLINLTNGEDNYKALGTIIDGQAKVLKDSYAISKQAYENMYKAEADAIKAEMDALLDSDGNIIAGKEEAFATYNKLWETAAEKSREAQETMLSDLQAWAETEKELLENTLADLGKTLEESLTGGTSFDELNTSMERAQSLQEEYLTTTNQIYETTKMMRTAQQAIDTTTNTIAKNKLKNFITETKTLQEQGALSKFELETQQAKYDLLVAEIALEEAQNAKNTVRLQRDSEGNFGYVYTADSKAVGEAQQQFDDAQNALYNKGLEGANNYSQKYTTTMQEMYDTLKTINENYMNGVYESEEEYQAAMTATKQYYYVQLAQYSSLYSAALSTDSRIVADSWHTDFQNMTMDASNWQTDVDDYLDGAGKAFNRWGGVVATVKQTTGTDLSALSNGVKAITDESAKLVESLTAEDTGLIPTLVNGFTEVKNAILEAFGIVPSNIKFTVNGNEPPGAATGGLTTSWGPEGKMLMVHENELILNSEQTNRFFDNLAFMESILATIDSYALNQQLSGALSSPNYIETHGDTLEQNVHIEASFPGVTDRSEIEEAFNNLVNKASQYANRK